MAIKKTNTAAAAFANIAQDVVSTITMPTFATMRGGVSISTAERIIDVSFNTVNKEMIVLTDKMNRKCRVEKFSNIEEARSLYKQLLAFKGTEIPVFFRAIGSNYIGVPNVDIGWFCHVIAA